jgi:hypothetical protein
MAKTLPVNDSIPYRGPRSLPAPQAGHAHKTRNPLPLHKCPFKDTCLFQQAGTCSIRFHNNPTRRHPQPRNETVERARTM